MTLVRYFIEFFCDSFLVNSAGGHCRYYSPLLDDRWDKILQPIGILAGTGTEEILERAALNRGNAEGILAIVAILEDVKDEVVRERVRVVDDFELVVFAESLDVVISCLNEIKSVLLGCSRYKKRMQVAANTNADSKIRNKEEYISLKSGVLVKMLQEFFC